MVTFFRNIFIVDSRDIEMQVKLLKDVVGAVAGPAAIGLVDLLYGKKNVNEFIIAKKMKLNINQTRNILYKLVDEGLVSFIRKKDRKNGGWYTYYWTLDISRSLDNLKRVIVNDMQQLETQLTTRTNERFYHCPNCDLEMNEENALLNNFTCPECGETFVLRDNTELVKKLEAAIARRKEQLVFVEQERAVVAKKAGHVLQRRMKADAKKRKTERDAKRKLRLLTEKKMGKGAKGSATKKKAPKAAKRKR